MTIDRFAGMDRPVRRVFLAIAVALALAGRSAASQPATFRRAPAPSSSWSNPYAPQSSAVLAGGKVYRQHCADCHGRDLTGTRSAPSLRTPAVRNAPPGELFWFVTNGNLKRGMPAWSRLPGERRWQIVTYLQSLQ